MDKKTNNGLHVIIKHILIKKGLLALVIFMILLDTTFTVAIPMVAMRLVDSIELKSISIGIILVIISVFLLQLIVTAMADYSLTYLSQDITKYLRDILWDKVLSLEISYFDNNQIGDILSKFNNDIIIVRDFLASSASNIIVNLIAVVGSAVMLIIIDWKIALIMMIAIPSSIVLLSFVSRDEYKISSKIQRINARYTSKINNVLSEIRLVKSYVGEPQEKKEVNDLTEQLFKCSLKEGLIMAFVRPLSTCLLMIIIVAIFGYAGLKVSQGTLTAGGMVAILSYLFQMTGPCSNIATFSAEYQKFKASSERIFDIMCQKSEVATYPISDICENNSGGLFVHNINFMYEKNDILTLTNVTIDINVGEVAALVGSSGAGKTTLFSILEMFYKPESGNIYFKNKNIFSYDKSEWRKKIAYVSQDTPIMYGTILSNLTYGMETFEMCEVEYAVKAAELFDFINSLPNKYDTIMGERGVKLSGGQKQRIAIARAMIKNPDILLLDEATSHLDSDSEQKVQKSLERLMAGRTTLIIAHRFSTIRNADKIYIMEKGKIVGSGTHELLMQTNSLYNKFVKYQSIEEKVVV